MKDLNYIMEFMNFLFQKSTMERSYLYIFRDPTLEINMMFCIELSRSSISNGLTI